MKPRDGSRRPVAAALAAACVAAAAHHRILWNDFVNLDDQLYVTQNGRVLEGLTAANAWWAVTALDAYNWHPLTWLSHMLDVTVWGQNPAGHHLTSLLLHAVNAALVFLLFARLTERTGRSLVVALLFATHPLHVESVAWVAERKDVLYAGLFFGSVLAYSWRAGRPAGTALAVSVVTGAAAMMAKPMAVTLPLVLLAVDTSPRGRIAAATPSLGRSRAIIDAVVAKWPWVVFAAGASYLTLIAQHRQGTGTVLYESAFADNLANAAVSYVRYLKKAFWPADLAVLYPWESSLLTLVPVAASLAVLGGVSVGVWRTRRSRPWVAFGWAWFAITLLPVIGVLRFGRQSIADRYTYVPLLGIYLLVTWVAADVLERIRAPRWPRIGCVAVATCFLAVLTIRHEERWRNSITLLEHAARVTRDNAVAHINLASAYAAAGDLARAKEAGELGRMYEARDIVEYQPRHPVAHYRLGNAYAEMGHHADAVSAFQRALQLQPAFPQAWNNLGVSLAQLGMLAPAAEAFERCLAIDPAHEEARFNLATLRREGTGAAASAPDHR